MRRWATSVWQAYTDNKHTPPAQHTRTRTLPPLCSMRAQEHQVVFFTSLFFGQYSFLYNFLPATHTHSWCANSKPSKILKFSTAPKRWTRSESWQERGGWCWSCWWGGGNEAWRTPPPRPPYWYQIFLSLSLSLSLSFSLSIHVCVCIDATPFPRPP